MAADLDLSVVVESAGLAPSVHNTQPWRITADDDVVELRADRSRQLSYLDPTGRQLLVSCGAAVEFGRLAVRAQGGECIVEVLPDSHDADLVARLRVGAAKPPTETELALAGAIPRRYTDRGPYDDREVPEVLLAEIGERSAELDVWLRVLNRDERTGVVLVLADAEAAEAADPRYAEELARWTTGRSEGEGIPEAARPEWPAERVSDLPLRDFTGHDAHPTSGGRGEASPPSVERDTVLMLGTGTDEPGAWIASGRALGWALLRIASAGLSAQPLGQAIDLASGRGRLRRDLGLVGHPQFLLRVGYGTGQPATQRRHS